MGKGVKQGRRGLRNGARASRATSKSSGEISAADGKSPAKAARIVRGIRNARAHGASVGVSFGVHALITSFIFLGPRLGPVYVADVGGGETGAIQVGIASDSAAPIPETPPEPTPPKLEAKVEKAKPRAPATPRHQRPTTVIVPPVEPIHSPSTVLEPTALMSTHAEDETPPSTLADRTRTRPTALTATAPAPLPGAATLAKVATAGGGATTVEAALPGRGGAPVFVSAEVASYLRAQDYFPSLPSSLQKTGAHYQARLDICVSSEGRVVDVDFRSADAPALDTVLAAAVKSWRYRPLIVDGLPAPFCHKMTVSYEM